MFQIQRVSSSKAHAAGKMQFDLDFLPKGYVIDSAYVRMVGTLNVPAAGLTALQQVRLLAQADCDGRRLRSDGLGLAYQDHHVQGRRAMNPVALAVNAAAAFDHYWPISFRDPRGVEPAEHSPATEFYKGKTLDVSWATPTDILAALAVNAGTTCEAVFFLRPRPARTVPTSVVQNFVEFTGKDIKLPRGRLVDLFIAKLDGADVTEAELGNVTLTIDGGENLLERARLPQLIRSFNRYVAAGSQVAAAGVAGESIAEVAGAQVAAFVPVWHPRRPFKGTKLPRIKETLFLNIDGTLAAGTARVYYRYIEEQDDVATVKAAVKVGDPVDASTVIKGKTSSKGDLSSEAKSERGAMARKLY